MKIVNENINKYLYSPSEEEIDKRLEDSNIEPYKLLLKSIDYGYLNGVKKAHKQGADIYKYQNSPLLRSARNGHLDIVKYLVEQGADIHAMDDAPLHYAAEGGHLDLVKYLVESGADIHAANDSAIKFAIWRNHLDVVKYLMKRGANIKITEGVLRETKRKGYEEMYDYLKSQINKE